MSFLHPWFLLLGLGIIIPVAVHLFNFRRYKTVYFTNVRMLRSLEMENKKQNRLLQRILLALRCLSILLLALLFASPYIENKEKSLVNQNSNAVVIILDNSFSMQNNARKGTAFETAKQKAQEIASMYSDNDAFCLLTQDAEGRLKHFTSKKNFGQLLAQTEISSSSNNVSYLVQTANKMLSLRNENGKKIFLISDFQRNFFDADKISTDSLTQCVFVPVTPLNTSNLYIDTVTAQGNVFMQGQKAELKVRIKNSSDTDAEKVTVKVFTEKTQRSIAVCDVNAHGYTDIDMGFVLQEKGNITGKVQIQDSPVTYDDDYYFCINVQDKIHVLCINGKDENSYINRLFRNSQEVLLNNTNINNVDFSSLNKYSLIILNSLKQIPQGLTQELKKHKDNGVSLLIIPDEDIDMASYTEAMRQWNLPYYFQRKEILNRVSVIDNHNSVFKNVFTRMSDNPEMPQCSLYYTLETGGKAAKEDILIMEDGNALVCQCQDNMSRAFVFASPLDEKYSDLVRQSIFVPLMWNIALYSCVISPLCGFISQNNFIDISVLNEGANPEFVTLKSMQDNYSMIPQTSVHNGRYGILINNGIKKAGFYSIWDKEKNIGCLAMNYLRKESDLTFLSPKDIDKQMKNTKSDNFSVFNDKKMIRTYFSQSKKAFDFSLLIIILIILTLAFEGYTARKINSKL